MSEKVDIGIITIRQDEYRALLDRFPVDTRPRGTQRRYSLSTVQADTGEDYRVALMRSVPQGNKAAQRTAASLIAETDPDWILVVGIGGGLPEAEFTLGDVVLATGVSDFSVQAAKEGGNRDFDISGGPAHPAVEDLLADLPAAPGIASWATSIGRSTPSVRTRKKNFLGGDAWNAKVRDSLEGHFFNGVARRERVFWTANIATSDTLMKDTQLAEDLTKYTRSIVGFEMEFGGVRAAARSRDREIPVLAIRGISDIVGFKRGPEWTAFACESAAAFAYALVKSGEIPQSRAATPRSATPPPVVSAEAEAPDEPWVDWVLHDAASLRALDPPTSHMLKRYFDGAAPTLRHVVSGAVPRRAIAASVEERLLNAWSDAVPALVLLLAEGGEGKSTVLLQIAAEMAVKHGWRVLTPAHFGAKLDAEWIRTLGEAEDPTLLAIDEADLLLGSLDKSAAVILKESLKHVHILAGARTGDWRRIANKWASSGGRTPDKWAGLELEVTKMPTLDAADATEIVGAWRASGTGLGELPEGEVDAELGLRLVQAARGTADRSLFGGLLDVRFSPEGLVDHARDLARALRDRADPSLDLIGGFFYVAAAEAAQAHGIEPEVLAALLEVVPARDIWTKVVRPMGNETTIARGGTALFTRHPKIAGAAVSSLARGDFQDLDLGSVYADLVRQTIQTASALGSPYWPSFGPTIHCAPRLADRLKRATRARIREAEAHRIAVQAAEAAMNAMKRVDVIIDYCATLDGAGRTPDALEAYRRKWPELSGLTDYQVSVRGFFRTWAATEGRAGAAGNNLFLALVSISDSLNPAPLKTDGRQGPLFGVSIALARLGRALQLLVEKKLDWIGPGLQATVALGDLTNPNETNKNYFERYRLTAKGLGHGLNIPPSEAMELLPRLAGEAYGILDDVRVSGITEPPLSFELLAATLPIDPEGRRA